MPTVRLPATIFLLSQLDKHLSPEEQQHLMGKDHAFMVCLQTFYLTYMWVADGTVVVHVSLTTVTRV